MPSSSRAGLKRCIELPQSTIYILHDAHVPSACIEKEAASGLQTDIDSLISVVGFSLASLSDHEPKYSLEGWHAQAT